MNSKAKVEWIERPTLYINLEQHGMRVSVHADVIWPVLAPFRVKGIDSISAYHLKDGSIVNIWHVDQAQRDAALELLLNDYFAELWQVFSYRAQPFTPVEPWLPGILEQL